MDYMTNNRNPSQLRCSTGHGIILNPQKSFYRIWYMKKVYSIIPISNNRNKLNLPNLNLKISKIQAMDPNIDFINENSLQ